jgi:AAA ATPase domain
LKGKAKPVPAYRLLRVHDAPERRHGELFVGRERELAILREAWERVQAQRRCELVTVAGDAGVGKSRLAAEFLATIEATVVRGRCLPYGEGIAWAFRKTLEHAAAERAIVGVFDDIHWGAETFLDLVEHVSTSTFWDRAARATAWPVGDSPDATSRGIHRYRSGSAGSRRDPRFLPQRAAGSPSDGSTERRFS